MVINMLKLFKQLSREVFKMYATVGKRVFDVVMSLVAIVILLPLFFVISVLIKIFDPGPVIFKQKRIGLDAKIFDFYKFRSMPVNTGDIPSDKVGEIRLTFVGKLIRRTNIDELPQLFNILMGDMSIVGPRPSLVSQVELIELRKSNGVYRCRPGLTGLAQISSFNGMTVHQKAFFDEQYVKTISFGRDVTIIFKTFGYIMKPPPVY